MRRGREAETGEKGWKVLRGGEMRRRGIEEWRRGEVDDGREGSVCEDV